MNRIPDRWISGFVLALAFAAPAFAAEAGALAPPAHIAAERQSLPEAQADEGGGLREHLTPPKGEESGVEVRSYEKNGATWTEYARHGRVYMIKVKPAIGPAYWLVDANGDGVFERRAPGGAKRPAPPEWVIKRF